MMSPEDKKEVVEQRIKPTVIRRRAKPLLTEEKPKAVAESTQGILEVKRKASPPRISAEEIEGATGREDQKSVEPPATLTVGVREKEEKPRRGPKRKKSKEELELEDIQRAGGLKQYAIQGQTEWEPSVERVFEPSLTLGRRKRTVRREFKKTAVTEIKTSKKVIRLEKGISVSELSQQMGVKTSELIKKLIGLGVMATANQTVDSDTATLLATDYGYEIIQTAFKEEEVLKPTQTAAPEGLKPRAPVVTVMGHVDHGKTSLLDAIRKTKVTEQEAGGITQHIGAYEVTLPKGSITFIDTPGHEAFTRMRARGAKVTDIVILVVAADDGIMPQTVEAINHARAAAVPIIVAINKIDKPGADPEKVKRGLTEQGLVSEEWGGDVICVPTSAKRGDGLEHLLEMILLVAQMQELKAPVVGLAKGIVIESRLDKGRGPLVTLLVQSGVVNNGDYIVSDLHYGRVKAMRSSEGKQIDHAYPAQPVELLGLSGVPEAGEELFVVEDERDAKRIAQTRQAKRRTQELTTTGKLSLEALQEQITKGESHELPLVVKADVAGSREALVDSLNKLSTEKVTVKVLHSSTGGIIETDVILAQASKAVIVGFNVAPEGKARLLAEQAGVEIRLHSIIYEVLEDIRKAMTGLLRPEIKEKFLGRAEVRQVFKVSKVGNIAGCQVAEGIIRRNVLVRLIREGTIVYEGKISSLKRFKDDVREVTSGMECGISVENFNDIKAGDLLEAFQKEEVAQTL